MKTYRWLLAVVMLFAAAAATPAQTPAPSPAPWWANYIIPALCVAVMLGVAFANRERGE